MTNLNFGDPVPDFSEQFIIDCNPSRWGCSGGSGQHTFNYWLVPEGLGQVREEDWPYIGVQDIARPNSNPRCPAYTSSDGLYGSLKTDAVPIDYIETYQYDSGDRIQDILDNATLVSPHNTYIRADRPQFRGYQSGIINDTCCGDYGKNYTLNHMVITVGYGI